MHQVLTLSAGDDSPIVINFPGNPGSIEMEKRTHVGFAGKYFLIGQKLQKLWITFIGFNQVNENSRIIPHTTECLASIMDKIAGRVIVLMWSSAGAGGILATPLAREVAQGMVLFNTNPFNAWIHWVESGFHDFKGWIDLYNGFQDWPGHIRWAEDIEKEKSSELVSRTNIEGKHGLTKEQTWIWIQKTLQRRKIVIE